VDDVTELRTAAALIRRRGTEATPGPWHRPLNTRYKHVVRAAKPDDEQGRYVDGRPEEVGVVQLNIWSDGRHDRKRGGRDLEWIALMDPRAAGPLARLMDTLAEDLAAAAKSWPATHEGADPVELVNEPGATSEMLNLARLINRTAS
jgi:hypothetical protein